MKAYIQLNWKMPSVSDIAAGVAMLQTHVPPQLVTEFTKSPRAEELSAAAQG